jgi:hypothetical protein
MTSSLELVQKVAIRVGLIFYPEILQIPTVAVVGPIQNEDVDGVEIRRRHSRGEEFPERCHAVMIWRNLSPCG